MGLLQQAVLTYDEMNHKVGVEYEGKVTLAPIGFINTKANIIITINIDGEFISAENCGKDGKDVIIPVTEKSSARTSGIEPHPLCDRIAYLIDDEKHKKKYNRFMEELKKWCDSNYSTKKICAVYKYLKKNTLLSDLIKCDAIKYKKNDKGEIEYSDAIMAVWNVIGDNNGISAIWKDELVILNFGKYYQDIISKIYDKGVCYVSGKKEMLATQNLKGIVNLHGNAKLISANDKTNFTYRGRFINNDEVTGISYISSQKAHNALKWLILNQGESFGKRLFLCWNPNGIELPKANTSLLLFSNENTCKNETEYRETMQNIINSYRYKIMNDNKAIIVIFDAATDGRLGILYYNEFLGSDFLDRLEKWDATCCWIDSKYGVYAPSLDSIVRYAFGTRRDENEKEVIEVDSKVYGEQMHRLLLSKLGDGNISFEIVNALLRNAGNIQIYNYNNRNRLLFITCAILRKYKMDKLKEECIMALEVEKKDRSYQYGRLLAILEKAERDTYDKDEKRETNAIRMQSIFVKRPIYASNIIISQIKNSYYPKLDVGLRVKYEKLIGGIFSVLSEFSDEEKAKPLNENYLFGYYLQKDELFKKTQNEKVETEEE